MHENYCHKCGSYTEIDDVTRLCARCYHSWLDRQPPRALVLHAPGSPSHGRGCWAELSRYADDTSAALDWARQAQRVLGSGELGWTLRFTGLFVIEVLIESGDLAAARRGLADSLDWIREASDRPRQATTLALLADLELRAGKHHRVRQAPARGHRGRRAERRALPAAQVP